MKLLYSSNNPFVYSDAFLSITFCMLLSTIPVLFKTQLAPPPTVAPNIGVPTINQHFDNNFVLPKKGVYASITVVEEKKYPSVTNIGLRPSFENEDFRSETCILGFSGNLYGQEIEVRLLQYLRDETKFDSLEKLSEQIGRDAGKSEEIFRNRGGNGDV